MARAKRLLLVEDNEVFGRSLSRGLRHKGLHVQWLCSCAEVHAALHEADHLTFDYVLVDDFLGDGLGLDLLPLLDALVPRPVIALVTADVTGERALKALCMGRVLLPKPCGMTETLELLAVLEQLGPPRVALPEALRATHADVPSFALELVFESHGVRTPTGTIALCGPSLAVLSALAERADHFTTAKELARALDRRDPAGPALVRRRVCDTRRALGPYAWLIESAPKHGYRLDQRVRVEGT